MIIGGSGFFGKSILDSYQRGLLDPWGIDEIKIISRSGASLGLLNPELISSSVKLISLDITTASILPEADYIIHAAASTNASLYLHSPIEEGKNLELSILNFCKVSKDLGFKSKILYVSSGAVYGYHSQDFKKISEDIISGSLEDMPLFKQGYAKAKRDGELAVRQLGCDGFNVSIARCFAFIGPYLPRDQHFAIGNFIEDGLQNRPILVKNAGKTYRSYMHADDLVQWLMTIVENSSINCPIYNVGSDEIILISDLAKKIGKYFNVPINVLDAIGAPVDYYIPSIKKAKDNLRLDIKIDIDEALDRTIKHIRSLLKETEKNEKVN